MSDRAAQYFADRDAEFDTKIKAASEAEREELNIEREWRLAEWADTEAVDAWSAKRLVDKADEIAARHAANAKAAEDRVSETEFAAYKAANPNEYADEWATSIEEHKAMAKADDQVRELKIAERVEALEIDQEARRRLAAKNYDGLGGLLTSAELQALDLSPWLLDGWLQIGETCMLVAKRNLGKSMFAFALGFSVAMGLPFLGATPEQGKVLFVLGEGTRGFYKRLKAWATVHGVPPEEVLEQVAVYKGGNVSNDSSLADIQNAVRSIDPILVVFDTWSKLSGSTSEIDAAENADVIGRFERIAPEATRLILHHPNQDTENTTAPKARGGTALTSNIDTVITLWQDRKHVVAGRPYDKWLAISTDIDHEGKQKDDVNNTLHGLSLIPVPGVGAYMDYHDATALSRSDQWVRDNVSTGTRVTINDLIGTTGASRSTVRNHLKNSSLVTEWPSPTGGPSEFTRGS